MSNKYQYIVDILAKNQQFVSSMNQNVQKVSNVDKKVRETNQTVNKMNTDLKGLAASLGIAFSVGAVIAFGKASAEAYNKQSQSEQALLVALKGRVDVQQRLVAQAAELQKKTLFADEDTIRAQSLIAAFVKEEDQIKKLTPIIQDFASAKQMDLATSADLITKTFASSTNALSRYGIEITGEAGSAERLNSIVTKLNGAFGGQAEAAAKVGTAALTQLKNSYGDLMEVVGHLTVAQQNQEGSFAKILTKATEGVTSYLGKVASWADVGLNFSQSLVAGLLTSDETAKKLAESMVVAKKSTDDSTESGKGFVSGLKFQAGSMGSLGEEITKLNEKLANTNSNDMVSIQLIGAKIMALTKLQTAIKNISSDPSSFRSDSLSSIATGIGKNKVSGGAEVKTTAKLDVSDILKNMPVYQQAHEQMLKYQDLMIEKQKAVTDALTSGFNQIGQSVVDGLGLAKTGFEGFVSGLAETAIKLISMMLAQSMANSIFGATSSAAATGPAAIFTTPAFIAEAIAGVLGAFAAIPKFATGGMVGGSSLYGDRMLARVNSGEEILTRNDPRHRLNGSGFMNGGSSSTVVLQPSIEYTMDGFRVRLNRSEKNVRKRT